MLFRSASKQRAWCYELALFTAWHTAAFNSQAKAGKLKDYEHYRTKFTSASTTTPSSQQSWKARKAERQRQMELLKHHQTKRKQPVRKRV